MQTWIIPMAHYTLVFGCTTTAYDGAPFILVEDRGDEPTLEQLEFLRFLRQRCLLYPDTYSGGTA